MKNSVIKKEWTQLKESIIKIWSGPRDYDLDMIDDDIKKLSERIREKFGDGKEVIETKSIEFKSVSYPKIKDNYVLPKNQNSLEQKNEQTKELKFLNSFSRLLRKENSNLENILDGTVVLLKSSFQQPEDVEVCIEYKGREYKTKEYKPTPWRIISPIELNGEQTGSIEVCYLSDPLSEDEYFTKEEELVLDTIAEHLSQFTEQIQGKVDLIKSKNQLSITLDSIGDGVIVTDATEKITRLNPKAEKLTGWSESEALGKPFSEVFNIINSKTGESVPNPVYRALKSGKTQGLELDAVLVARDGTKRHIADSAAPIRDYNNEIFSVIMVFSDVTERRIAEESLKYQLDFEKMLAEVSNSFSVLPSDQIDKSIEIALRQIRDFFQIKQSYIFEFSEDGKIMSNVYEQDNQLKERILQIFSSDSFAWFVERIKDKKCVYIPNVDSLPTKEAKEITELKSLNITSILSIPMINNGLIFGFLSLIDEKENKPWTDNQIKLLTVVTELVSNAYIRKMAEEKIRYQSFHDGLTGLHNRVYLENEMKRLDSDRQLPIGLIMVDANGLKLFNDSFGHNAGDEVLKHASEILRSSCRGEDIISRWGGDEFVILLPQTTEKEIIAICKRISQKCSETLVRGLPISLAVGYAVKNNANQVLSKKLIESEESMYKQKLAENQWVKSSLIKRILKNLEDKSFETGSHYLIMHNVAHKIGKEIGLSKLDFKKLEMLALLHDIGKANISIDILNKKTPLTDEEWDSIKKHPEIGYRIVNATEEFSFIAEDILSHHEHWEGKGYPQGLEGKEIPLLARIIAIADAYEVMSSGRPYKKTMTWKEIVEEMKRCSGTQFDPDIVEIFIQFSEVGIRDIPEGFILVDHLPKNFISFSL